MAELSKVIESGDIFQETSMTDNSDLLFFIDKDLLQDYGSAYSRERYSSCPRLKAPVLLIIWEITE